MRKTRREPNNVAAGGRQARRIASVVLAALSTAVVIAACGTGSGGPKGTVKLPSAGASASVNAQSIALKTINGPAASGATKTATAKCARGSLLTGGGIATILAGGGTPPSSLHVDGTVPGIPGSAGSSGAAAADDWSALGATGGQLVVGGVSTAYAMCARGSLVTHGVNVVATTMRGPSAAATTTHATANCPSGTVLLGGGGFARLAKGISAPSLRLIGSYPSDGSGTAVTDMTKSPQSWTALVDSGGRGGGGVSTEAFALCAAEANGQTEVAVAAHPGPLSSGAATPVTASCPAGTVLISGGAKAGPKHGLPQQGLHLTGSFPSDDRGDSAGTPKAKSTINSWTARAEAGGQGSPTGTETTAFAVCLR